MLSHYVGVCRYVTECVVGLGDSSAITVTIFCSKNIAIVKISRYLIIFANKYQKIHRHLLLLQKTVLVKVFSKEDQHVDILRQKTCPFFGYDVASYASILQQTCESREAKVFPNRAFTAFQWE